MSADPIYVGNAVAESGVAERRDWSRLSPRDGLLLEHISLGLTDERIGEQLQLSPESVRSHVRRVVEAIGARNRTHAVALALRAGRIA